jgi:hypothetical protein
VDCGGAGDLVRCCLHPDPARRPSVHLLLLRHPFLLAPSLAPCGGGGAAGAAGGLGGWAVRAQEAARLARRRWGAAARRAWGWAVGLEGAFADGAAEAEFVRDWQFGAAGRARGTLIACMPVRRKHCDMYMYI